MLNISLFVQIFFDFNKIFLNKIFKFISSTTLRDYVDGAGRSGYFAQQLLVYGRAGQPCRRCAHEIESLRLGQRATYFCPQCQS